MPIFQTRTPQFNSGKDLNFNWENFRGGLNTLFKDTEIKSNELAQANNLMLTGEGIPTKRWGTALYNTAGATGAVRGMSGFYQADGTNELLSVTDWGLLGKKNGSSYTEITGASWPSGSMVEMSQLADNMYIVSAGREHAYYDGSTLVGFSTVAAPSSVFATQISGVSGTNTFSYRLSHITNVGETTPSSAYTFVDQPEDPSDGSTKVSWANASNASIIVGTNIYGRKLGNESFLAQVDGEATEWIDDGSSVPSLFGYAYLVVDSTGGIKAKYIKRFKDRLIYAGIPSAPTRVMISARYQDHEKFDLASGGGLIDIEPDSGDNITGLEIKGDKIIVFKERSIWEVEIDGDWYGNYFLIEPKATLITNAIGCSSSRSIRHVENDILFLATGGRGIYVLGNEPGIIGDILRTNEVSVRIRPFFENLTPAQESNACAAYFNNKYFIGIPGKNQTMVFDRERNAWMGPWTFDANIFDVYYDSNSQPTLIKGNSATPEIENIDDSYRDDRGSSFSTTLRTKREDFGDFSSYKTVRDIFTLWRNVTGSVGVDIRLEQPSGNTLTAESFSITPAAGNAGWGADQWGNTQWADSEEGGNAQDLSEIIRQTKLRKSARNTQLIVKTSNAGDNYELMSVKGEAHKLGKFRPLSWKT